MTCNTGSMIFCASSGSSSSTNRSRAAYVSKEHGDLLPFSFQGMPRRQDLFGQMFGKVGVGRGGSGGRSRSGCRSLIDRVTAIAAELRGAAIGLAAVRTGCFETRPALVTKSGVGHILVLASRAIHISMSLRSEFKIRPRYSSCGFLMQVWARLCTTCCHSNFLIVSA